MTDTQTDTPLAARASLIGHVEVSCEAVLGNGTITVTQLEALRAGDTVPLDRSPADLVDVRVNGRTIARGEIVTLGDRFAIRLVELG